MTKRKKRIIWEPGDPITDKQDRARRKYSPEVLESERDCYETKIWAVRLGGVLTEVEEIHTVARKHVLMMRHVEYQRNLGAMQVEKVRQEQVSAHAEMMRSARADALIERRATRRAEAESALEWARQNYPTANADNKVSYLKQKAADHLGISKRYLGQLLKQ